MSYSVVIKYNPANDIFNACKDNDSVVTSAPIPGMGDRTAPSDAYVYAPESATSQVFNKECLCTVDKNGVVQSTDTYVTAAYSTSGQRRWPKGTTDSIKAILEAYATPQVPVYKAWQTFKLAINGSTPYKFEVPTMAESEFYREAGLALSKYGIVVETAVVTATA